MKRLTPEEKYKLNLRKQEKILEDFAAHEIEYANDLIYWYKLRKEEMPNDQYRACAFFINKEYLQKKGSLTLLYEVYIRCVRELPPVTKEMAFDLLCFRYALYAKTLETGGYNGGINWR